MRFKPYYNWNTFNTTATKILGSFTGRFKPYYNWNTFNTLSDRKEIEIIIVLVNFYIVAKFNRLSFYLYLRNKFILIFLKRIYKKSIKMSIIIFSINKKLKR